MLRSTRSTTNVVALIVVLVASSGIAAPCFDYEQILPDVGSVALAADPVAIAVSNGHAYVADATPALQVVDVTDPTSPAVVATLGGLGTLKGLVSSGTMLYVASSTGLHVIDVANPSMPAEVGSHPGSLEALVFYGTSTVAAAAADGLRFYDVTDPAAPVLVSTLPFPGGAARDVLLHEDKLYVAAGYDLQVVSTDAAMPSILGQGLAFPPDGRLAIEGNTLLIGNIAYDLTDPLAPEIVGTPPYMQNPETRVAKVVGTTTYEPGYYLLQLVEVSATPLDAQMLGFADLYPWRIRSIEIHNGFSYVGTQYSTQSAWQLHVIDLGTLQPSPQIVLDTPGSANDVAVQGDYAYVADGVAGLQIVDLSEPFAPAIIGGVTTPSSATRVAVAGNLACVKRGTSLQVIDVSDPANPVLGVTLPAAMSSGSDVAMTPGFAFVTVQVGPDSYRLQAIDVSDPGSPVLAGSISSYYTYDIEITGNTACQLVSGGVLFVDISNPAALVPSGTSGNLGSTVLGMAVDGVRVYVSELHGSLYVFDITNPAAPVALPSLWGTFTGSLAASRSTVYLSSASQFGLCTFDVGNSSTAPEFISGSILDWTLFRMRAAGNVLLAPIGPLVILPTQCLDATDTAREETATARSVVLRPAWPNPSRGEAMLQYELPLATAAALRVYDVAGKLVRELHGGNLPAGPHTARWNGLDTAGRRAANGVYFARLETPFATVSRRVTLVR